MVQDRIFDRPSARVGGGHTENPREGSAFPTLFIFVSVVSFGHIVIRLRKTAQVYCIHMEG